MEKVVNLSEEITPSEFELYLFHEGTLYESYRMLGAHFLEIQGIKGVRFTVWAPHASAVSVVGDFNGWNNEKNKMERIPLSGVWVTFIPDLQEGEIYKYAIQHISGKTVLKADPYAFHSEVRPQTASKVYSLDGYEWHDQLYLNERRKYLSHEKPMLIYEVHLGSWKLHSDGEPYTYRELARDLIEYVVDQGFTHIELLPIMEHPFDRSWGYQITGYFAVTSRFGTPKDFMYFIDQCHAHGIGVILDWVPLHFCKDLHGLGRFDGTPLYEPADPQLAERVNWGTYNFDFEKPEIASFLISNALFWLSVFHVDGLRIDAVSSMIYYNHDQSLPVPIKNKDGSEENLEAIAFIKRLNEVVFDRLPDCLMIAEEATDWPLVSAPTYSGGLGFNYKWNMGWTHDVLKYMRYDMEERRHHHNLLTFSLYYAFSENFVLPFSHDEVVYGKRSLLHKMPGSYEQKFANYRLLYGYFLTHPGKKLLFMGSEFAQFDEWKDYTELDWQLLDYDSHRKFQFYVKSLNHLYQSLSCLWRLDHDSEGFHWIDPNSSSESIINFLRKGRRKGDICVVVCNFSNQLYSKYRVGVPSSGKYIEMFNSDEEIFGGNGQVHQSAIPVEKEPYQNQPYSIEITVPPLSMILLMKETNKRRGRAILNAK